ncbi:protein yippee-like [Selaginella moellendorffii]|uniref:protein yippee-like n=1 Tax=Selaginella moellendorffii TaxID=88036 RepID=UPI000D1C2E57|nr:protein yippee-like [Selaginella moellendorffii]|eukprot:XP_024530248.1 protein yippee-like [Selaginella moellendorffii]
MGRLCLIHLDGKIYSCRICHSHLATPGDLMAKNFHCRHGTAYLFKTVVNVGIGKLEERQMTTGLHTVADIYCICCRKILGWKYETAQEKDQKYKEGKFILERKMIAGGEGHELRDEEVLGSDGDE